MSLLNEEKIILSIAKKNLFNNDSVIGIGDDAAYISDFLITKDLLIENIHFHLDYFSPAALAHKSFHVNLSDIAAMGGKPKYLLLGLAIPSKISSLWIQNFLRYFQKLCKKYKVMIIGGDTTGSDKNLMISITLIGEKLNSLKKRNTAQAGDFLCITSPLGEAHAGLIALEKKIPGFNSLKKKQLYPEARLLEGQFLADQAGITGMMDISDGLYLDIKKFCGANKLGAKIEINSLPLSSELIHFSKKIKESPISLAISGGEDYELLCSVSPLSWSRIQRQYQKKFQRPLYKIGLLTLPQKINYYVDSKKENLKLFPFTHF